MDGSDGEDIPVKRSKKSCKFLERWLREFPFLKRSRMGNGHSFCKICNCDFSVFHGGRTDVIQHEISAKHKHCLDELKQNGQAMSAFPTRSSTEYYQVINAEFKMAMMCAKNNASFTFCDDFNRCVAVMFPDSAIAQKYSAGKTKATQLIKGAIAALLDDELDKTCRSQAFSLMCDKSNNSKTDEEVVTLNRLYYEAILQVATRFMETPICNVGNEENLHEKLSEALRKRGIPWENLIAFNSDNVSLVKDRLNYVISKLKTCHPHVQEFGCICHLAQLASGCAIRAAQMPVEDILVGIYIHFDKSAKRFGIDGEFIDFTDSDHLRLLKYCSTSWLSLLPCIQRVLNQWDTLQAYFNRHEEVEWSAKVHDLASHLRDPVMKIYFMFLTAALKPLSEFNIAFQAEKVQIHRLEEEMGRLIRRILGYLIPARAIVGVPLKEVEYGEGHQLPDEDLFIGADTKAFMKSVELPVSTEKKIFQSVRRFYEAVLQKMFSSFPLHPLKRELKVVDPAACLAIAPGTAQDLADLFTRTQLKERHEATSTGHETMSQRHTEASHLCDEEKEAAVNVIQIPMRFEDVAVYFTEEEWVLLEWGQQALYQTVMMEIYRTFVFLAEGNHSQFKFPESICPEGMEKTNLSRASLERTEEKCFQNHKGDTESLQDIKPDLALLCEEAVENVPMWTVFGELMSHKRREGDPECEGNSLPLSVDLAENQARQTEGAKRYSCSNCEKQFDESADLVAHERDHITERVYHCSDCKKRFSHFEDLRSHKKNHQGEKPHWCPPDCNRCTQHKVADLRVPRIPSPEPPCECPACGVIFSCEANLIRHWRLHRGETLSAGKATQRENISGNT